MEKVDNKINCQRNDGSDESRFGFGKEKTNVEIRNEKQETKFLEKGFGKKKFMKGKGKKNAEIGGEPVWLAESGKNPGLNILNPKMLINAKVLQNTKS